jgi:hypothetical protein
MRQFLRQLATIGVLASLVAVAPKGATADEYQGRWFGGVDLVVEITDGISGTLPVLS